MRAQRRIVVVVSALAALTASAYVLPSVSIIRRLVERRDDLHLSALKVDGTVIFPTETAQEPAAALGVPGDHEIQADGTVSLKLPGRCRMEVRVPEGGLSASVSSQGRRRTEGKEIAAISTAVAEICPLLALRSTSEGEARDGLERHLKSLGIDTRQTSLARFEGRIAYVIGKTAEGSPQFWVYKGDRDESGAFLPARVLFKDATGQQWDVRLRDFGSPVTGYWFPRIVEVARNDQLLMRFTALTANGTPKLPDSLF